MSYVAVRREAGRASPLIMAADSEAEIRLLLADDPWEQTGQLRNIELWRILVGTERLAGADGTKR